jgi:hypothetical protein
VILVVGWLLLPCDQQLAVSSCCAKCRRHLTSLLCLYSVPFQFWWRTTELQRMGGVCYAEVAVDCLQLKGSRWMPAEKKASRQCMAANQHHSQELHVRQTHQIMKWVRRQVWIT